MMRHVTISPRACRLVAVLLLALAAAPSLWAQAEAVTAQERAKRQKISDALSKNDSATALKLLSEAKATTPQPIVSFEELKACGLYPQKTRVECVLDIKLPFGFGGPIGSFGSFEFVKLCVDWDGNQAFTATESVGEAIVHLHDESANGAPPWQYAVYYDINPPGGPRTSNGGATTTTTTNGPSFRARAILSWSVSPTDCNFIPVFGNVLAFQIRLDPIR